MKDLFKVQSVENSGNFTITTTPRGCKFIEGDDNNPCLDVKAMFVAEDNEMLFYNLSTNFTASNKQKVIFDAIKTVLSLVYKDHGEDVKANLYITDWIADETITLDPNNPNVTVIKDYSSLIEKAQNLFDTQIVH